VDAVAGLFVLCFFLPFTVIGVRGGLYQSRHILPAVPAIALLVGRFVDKRGGGRGELLLVAATCVGAVNTVVAVVYAAPVAADFVRGAWDVAGGLESAAPWVGIGQGGGQDEQIKAALSHYGLIT
jgi:hypothetical protein